jgi:hypothetical protein
MADRSFLAWQRLRMGQLNHGPYPTHFGVANHSGREVISVDRNKWCYRKLTYVLRLPLPETQSISL